MGEEKDGVWTHFKALSYMRLDPQRILGLAGGILFSELPPDTRGAPTHRHERSGGINNHQPGVIVGGKFVLWCDTKYKY